MSLGICVLTTLPCPGNSDISLSLRTNRLQNQSMVCGSAESNITWKHVRNIHSGNSLMVQWLRLMLALQGAWVRSLVRDLRSSSCATQSINELNKDMNIHRPTSNLLHQNLHFNRILRCFICMLTCLKKHLKTTCLCQWFSSQLDLENHPASLKKQTNKKKNCRSRLVLPRTN